MDALPNNTFPMIDKTISKPLTDNRTANALRDNTEGLLAAGREPDMSDLRYIKLNRFEQREQAYKELCEQFVADIKRNDMTGMHVLVESLSSVKTMMNTPDIEPKIEIIKAIEEEVTKPTAIVRGQRRNTHLIEDVVPDKLEDTNADN